MLAFKLALKNLIGAGLRTWLTVFVLSLSFVLIIFQSGYLDGWNNQAKIDMTEWEVGGGEYWHNLYDPYDPFSLNDSHDKLPPELDKMYREGLATPVLITQGSVFPAQNLLRRLIR